MAINQERQYHIEIVRAAQQSDSDSEAVKALLAALVDLPAVGALRHYEWRGIPELEHDALLQEYLVGAYLYLPKVRLDIGDPLLHLAWRGLRAVGQYRRSILRQDYAKTCPACGRRFSATTRLMTCPDCGVKLELTSQTLPVLVDENGTPLDIPDKTPPLDPSVGVLLERFVATLDREGTRLGDLVRLMLTHELYPGCGRNYCQELARLMGLSPAGVVYWLRRLRERLHRFCAEEGWTLEG